MTTFEGSFSKTLGDADASSGGAGDVATGYGKVPAVTLGFWIIKIAATTLGETGGDAVTMSLGLGYLVGTLIFAAISAILVAAPIRARRFRPFLFWAVIIATTTVGTTLADFADRSLGIGYVGGSLLLLACLLASLGVRCRVLGSVSVRTVMAPRAEAFYWATILFSQTLGTALGDLLDKPRARRPRPRPVLRLRRARALHRRLHHPHSAEGRERPTPDPVIGSVTRAKSLRPACPLAGSSIGSITSDGRA